MIGPHNAELLLAGAGVRGHAPHGVQEQLGAAAGADLHPLQGRQAHLRHRGPRGYRPVTGGGRHLFRSVRCFM